jgi:hypothetical protein
MAPESQVLAAEHESREQSQKQFASIKISEAPTKDHADNYHG